MENLRRNSSPLRNHDGQLADGRAEIEIYRRVVSFLGALEISSRKMVSEFREGSGSRLIYGFKFRLR